jgi:hypothetical protein
MRASLTVLALVVTCCTSNSAALADDAPLVSPPNHTVYLDGPADLARLRAANPGHYARAQPILAAANQLCRPGHAQLLGVSGARDFRCAEAFLRTSNPPKREISFTLDDTRYIALVVVTDDPPRLTPAN